MELPESQTQRTVLAWDRTAVALLINGALLLMRNVQGGGVTALVPAQFALVAALLVAVVGRWRSRRLRRSASSPVAAVTALTVTGSAVIVVGLAVVASLVLGSR